jgi:hypothetical protein
VELFGLIAVAIVAESIWETIKMIGKDGRFNWDIIGALLIGLLIALGTGADLFQLMGIPFRVPYIGTILTGLLISRGANFMHDLFKALKISNEIKAAQKAKINGRN